MYGEEEIVCFCPCSHSYCVYDYEYENFEWFYGDEDIIVDVCPNCDAELLVESDEPMVILDGEIIYCD